MSLDSEALLILDVIACIVKASGRCHTLGILPVVFAVAGLEYVCARWVTLRHRFEVFSSNTRKEIRLFRCRERLNQKTPPGFTFPYSLGQDLPYQFSVEQCDGGLLQQGEVIWFREPLRPDTTRGRLLAYALGYGIIVIDTSYLPKGPRLLTSDEQATSEVFGEN